MVIVYDAGGYKKEVRKTPTYDPRTDPTMYVKPTWRGTPMQIPSVDLNGVSDVDGIPSKFTSPEFYTHRGGYVGEPSAPSREQFVSEGGLFGEGAGVAVGAEEGYAFGEEKEGFDWEFWLLIGGIILLFIIVAIF